MQHTGTIFNIQRFSTHDGPGIRTTVFFKGCNLRCRWCHNPESYAAGSVIQYFRDKCVRCGECERVCPQGIHIVTASKDPSDKTASEGPQRRPDANSERNLLPDHREAPGGRSPADVCTRCGRCVSACLSGALKLAGESYHAEELAEVLRRDFDYYESSGGGVTASGGEPLLQADFVGELFALLHSEGIRTALDTAGNVPFDRFERVLPGTDLVLLDLKCMDDAVHRVCTGGSNAQILSNARRLFERGQRMHIRVPVIPGMNDLPEHFRALHDFLQGADTVEELRFLPYHSMGITKAESVGQEMETYRTPTQERMDQIREQFSDLGFRVT